MFYASLSLCFSLSLTFSISLSSWLDVKTRMRAAKLRTVEARARRDYRIPPLPLSICVSIFHSWNYKESDLILRNAAGSHSVSLSAELHEPLVL